LNLSTVLKTVSTTTYNNFLSNVSASSMKNMFNTSSWGTMNSGSISKSTTTINPSFGTTTYSLGNPGESVTHNRTVNVTSDGSLILNNGDSNDFNYAAFKLAYAVDSSGNNASFNSVSWNPTTYTTFNGVPVINQSYEVAYSIKNSTVLFAIGHYTFQEAGNFSYGNNTYQVAEGATWMFMGCSNWPFNVSGSSLTFAFQIMASGSGAQTNNGQPQALNLGLGNANLTFPSYGMQDGNAQGVNVSYYADSMNGTSAAEVRVSFTNVPKGTSYIYYDPVTSLQDGTGVSLSSSSSSGSTNSAPTGSPPPNNGASSIKVATSSILAVVMLMISAVLLY